MQRVAHYSPDYLSLTKTWLYAQIANLSRFEPFVLCRITENLDRFPTESVFSFHDSLSWPMKRYYRLRSRRNYYNLYFESVVRSQRPALLHAHFGNYGYHILPLARKLGLPLVTSFYGFDASRLVKVEPEWRERYKELFRDGAAFIAEGSHMGRTLEELGCPRDKIHVIRLGIDLARLPLEERPAADEIRVLAAGSFREKKGHRYAIEAVAIAARARPDISLTIIGDAEPHRRSEVEEKKKIMETIESVALSDRVKLMGYRPYDVFIRELYTHHIFLSPSVQAADGDTEGGAPVSIIEASASGMPVVSTTHCDIPEVVVDGESGFLVPERDADALAERLGRLCEDIELRRRMGRAGNEHIGKNYDVKKQAPKLEEVYEQVITEKHGLKPGGS